MLTDWMPNRDFLFDWPGRRDKTVKPELFRQKRDVWYAYAFSNSNFYISNVSWNKYTMLFTSSTCKVLYVMVILKKVYPRTHKLSKVAIRTPENLVSHPRARSRESSVGNRCSIGITLLLLVLSTYIWVLFVAHITSSWIAHSTQRRVCNSTYAHHPLKFAGISSKRFAVISFLIRTTQACSLQNFVLYSRDGKLLCEAPQRSQNYAFQHKHLQECFSNIYASFVKNWVQNMKNALRCLFFNRATGLCSQPIGLLLLRVDGNALAEEIWMQ